MIPPSLLCTSPALDGSRLAVQAKHLIYVPVVRDKQSYAISLPRKDAKQQLILLWSYYGQKMSQKQLNLNCTAQSVLCVALLTITVAVIQVTGTSCAKIGSIISIRQLCFKPMWMSSFNV